ncbi:MAG: hypothetical protein QXI12_05175 [Candidatus Methanomethyliaceae archaeon]
MVNWDGIVRGKKTIRLGDETIDCCGARHIREWIQPSAYAVDMLIKDCIPKAKEFQSRYSSYNFSFEHHLIYSIWGWVNRNISYKLDEMSKYPDYWNDVWETYFDRWGDCEDASILCASAVHRLYYGRDSPVSLAIGFVWISGIPFGHAWCYYDCKEFNRRVVLECTADDYIEPNTYIVGVQYHPTVIVDSSSSTQVCDCDMCKTMINYLSTGTNKGAWASKILRPNIKLEAFEKKPSLFSKLFGSVRRI